MNSGFDPQRGQISLCPYVFHFQIGGAFFEKEAGRYRVLLKGFKKKKKPRSSLLSGAKRVAWLRSDPEIRGV